MSQEERETLRLVYEAYNRGDWTGALSRMHRDIEWKTTRTGRHRGHDEVRRFMEDMREPFEEVMVEPDEWFDHGDRIVVFLRIRARPRGKRRHGGKPRRTPLDHARRQGDSLRDLPQA